MSQMRVHDHGDGQASTHRELPRADRREVERHCEGGNGAEACENIWTKLSMGKRNNETEPDRELQTDTPMTKTTRSGSCSGAAPSSSSSSSGHEEDMLKKTVKHSKTLEKVQAEKDAERLHEIMELEEVSVNEEESEWKAEEETRGPKVW